jgi:hypothetical protein
VKQDHDYETLRDLGPEPPWLVRSIVYVLAVMLVPVIWLKDRVEALAGRRGPPGAPLG